MGFWNRFSVDFGRFSALNGDNPSLSLNNPTFYEDYRDVPLDDGIWAKNWPNFTPDELACPRYGNLLVDPASLDALQHMRDKLGPLVVNSAHRSPQHNAAVGGAPRSAHLRLAFDLHLGDYSRERIFMAARLSGFRSMGFYVNFLHVDLRPGRRWFGRDPKARVLWEKALGPGVLRW